MSESDTKKINLLSSSLPGRLEAGCDEAGRGPLIGSVFAAAVILPEDFYHPLLNDSKQMSEKNRSLLREIIEKEAIDYAVSEVDAETIDKINILNASILAMKKAVEKLKVQPEFLLIDGNRFDKAYDKIPYMTVIKGDSVYSSIAAASVLAKTYRDEYMRELALQYPQYHLDKNKGYPTSQHLEAIKKYGYTPLHRRSFKPKYLESE